MPRNFNIDSLRQGLSRPLASFSWIRAVLLLLVVLNIVALYFYFLPPGGSKSQLTEELSGLNQQIAATRQSSERLKRTSGKVQAGNTQATSFTADAFLPRHTAYAQLVDTMQLLARESSLQDKGSTTSEEPIEGTDDLTLLNVIGNYEGSYVNLMQFLNKVDRARQFLILDSLTATPVQTGGKLSVAVRVQAIVREDGSGQSGGGI